MMRTPFWPVVLVMVLLSTACGIAGPTQPPGEGPERSEEDVIYLNLVWHQHQPLYYKDETGTYTRPWARAHATKDYYDMAALLQAYPGVHVTFNLTPVLIRQLDDLASGARDLYRVLAEIPASELSDEQKRFILTRFFDANWDHIIARYPRYEELLNLRGRDEDPQTIDAAMEAFTEEDFRDLQVWWNLAWFDPGFLDVEPLNALVQQGRGFSEADKRVIFEEVDRIVASIIPLHRALQEAGQIEVIVTPYAHPILPLLYATDLAAEGDPGAELPERFSYPNDAIGQVARAVEVYQEHFGRAPRGMWPAEGAVAEEIVKLVADAGFLWMASGEHVLAGSLGMSGFTRDAQEVVQEADALYRPYYVRFRDGPPVAVVFRDLRLSDLVGFEYSGDPGEVAAQDFIDRIEAIRTRLRQEGAEGPHLVSVILDGENAWEHYDNDGLEFLNALYAGLQASETIRTVTPSEYLAMFPDQREIEDLWPGAWFSSDFGTWIGEQEENTAWEYLRETREALAPYDITERQAIDPQALDAALDMMYLAEGSDWFWWYGSDQDSGNDAYFDEAFRALLREVYLALGLTPPAFVNIPIIPERAVDPTRPVQDVLSPTVDGTAAEGEWDLAGVVEHRGDSQARAGDVLSSISFGYDRTHLFVRVDGREDFAVHSPGVLGLYLGVSGAAPTTALAHYGGEEAVLGYGAVALLEIRFAPDGSATPGLYLADGRSGWGPARTPEGLQVEAGARTLELAVPLSLLGEPGAGERVILKAVWSLGEGESVRNLQWLPAEGPVQFTLPDLSAVDYFLVVDDPPGDDVGPGTYTYPTDGVFKDGVYDVLRFSAGVEGAEFAFRFELDGPVENPWGSGIDLSVQTFDIYLDFDPGGGTGARMLLEGRNAALAPEDGWDLAVWVEGWHQKLFVPDEQGIPREVSGSNIRVIVDPRGIVTLRVDARAIPALGAVEEGSWALDPRGFGYVAAVLSQEGFPSAGVRRVRDVEPTASQWRIGGGPQDTNHTRIMDLVWDGDQTLLLAGYPSRQDPVGNLSADDFARVPLLLVP